MKKIVIFFTLCLLTGYTFYSCTKETYYIPSRHETKEFDLNNDLINDVRIQYIAMTWDGVGPDGTGDLIEGEILPINNTRLLSKEVSGSLFPPLKDTLHFQMKSPYSWDVSSHNLVEIRTYINKWPKVWTVNFAEASEYFYIAFVKTTDTRNQLGWIRIKIDTSTGLIEIIDTKISDQDFLIIGKK
jgi:hypothetical protein